MAEGGDHLSIQDGSDAYFAFTCTPCIDEGTREEAVKYCPECEEYLCTTCTKYHRKVKASRDHKLVDREEGKHKSNFATATTKIKCRQHPDRIIEMYCGAHDMVYCLLCIATEHRACRDVTSLTDAASSSFHKNEIDHMKDESKSINKLLMGMEKTKEENVALLKEKRSQIQKRVHKLEESMVEHIKTLSRKATATLEETYSKVNEELESDIALVNRSKFEVEKVNEQLKPETEMNQEQRFAKVKLCQHIINDAKRLHTKFELNGQISIEFEESTDVKEQFLDIKTIGKIQKVRANRNREIQRQKEVNVKMQNDHNTCRIIDICHLDNGHFILADCNNKNVKLMDTDHNLTDHFSVDGCPTGICKISQNEVAVKLATDNIELLSVGPGMSKLRSFSIKQGGGYWGMTYTTGKLWIGTLSGIDVYAINGTFEKRVDLNMVRLQNILIQMTVFQNSVFVVDLSNRVLCLKSDGTKKAEFRDNRLNSTAGVCVSSDGTVYTIDRSSNKIVMFNQNGKCLGELVSSGCIFKPPKSLSYDDKNNCILIGYETSDTVTVLHLK